MSSSGSTRLKLWIRSNVAHHPQQIASAITDSPAERLRQRLLAVGGHGSCCAAIPILIPLNTLGQNLDAIGVVDRAKIGEFYYEAAGRGDSPHIAGVGDFALIPPERLRLVEAVGFE